MVFRDDWGDKHYVCNTFMESEEVVTFCFWMKERRCWKFVTEWKHDFVHRFKCGCHWELKKHQKEFEKYLKNQH